MRRRIAVLVMILGVVAAGAYTSVRVYQAHVDATQRQMMLEGRRTAWKKLAGTVGKRMAGFNGTVAVVLKDLKSGATVVAHKDRSLPSASLAKMPIMAACFVAAAEGRLSLNETIRLTNAHKVSGSGALQRAPSGGYYTIEKLIVLMIAESDNTAANMLIKRLGMEYLNSSFRAIGLTGTNLSREMMDFKSRKKGIENYTTARDIAFLLEKMYRGKLVNRSVSKKCLGILAGQKVNDRIPKKLPPGTVVAHKTGLEKAICHDAGIVCTPKGDFLICVLVQHRYKRAREAKALIADIALASYERCMAM